MKSVLERLSRSLGKQGGAECFACEVLFYDGLKVCDNCLYRDLDSSLDERNFWKFNTNDDDWVVPFSALRGCWNSMFCEIQHTVFLACCPTQLHDQTKDPRK